MPHLRGIEVSIVTVPDKELVPEYPHPEGSSVRVRTASQEVVSVSGTPDYVETCPAKFHKSSPAVSVYVPSIPGTRFAIRYNISQAPPAPCRFMFFRLYVNGKATAAWGIDLEKQSKGHVSRSLWAPGSRHYEQVGYEGRDFVFLPGQEHKSVAEDGGLIEIHAFRVKQRVRRAPILNEFRVQENYGVATPSTGLIDRPQDTTFYAWHLLDPKDIPFACFRLHYRSWSNLEQLSLIPPTELDFVKAVSPVPKNYFVSDTGDTESLAVDTSEDVFPASRTSDEAVFEDSGGDHKLAHYVLRSPPERFVVSTAASQIPQPSKVMRDAYRASYLQRPLPELPVCEPSGGRIRRSSAASAAPSIASSLRRELDDSSFSIKEAELGIAKVIHLPKSESGVLIEQNEGTNSSLSNYELSPQSTNDSGSLTVLSPSSYMPMTGTNFENGVAAYTPPAKKPPAYPPKIDARQLLVPAIMRDQQAYHNPGHPFHRVETLTLTEAEWIRRSPSPRQPRQDLHNDGHLRSPRLSRSGGRSLLAGLRKKKFSASPRKLAEMITGRDMPHPHPESASDGSLSRGRVGNWI